VPTQSPAHVPIPALFAAANRAAVYGTIARWLMHDLRGPAQALSLVLDLLEQGAADDDPALRQTLNDASGRLRSLLDLLDRTLRLPSPAEPSPLVLHEITDFLGELQRSSRSPVTLDADGIRAARLPAVHGTEEHLTHALLNLVVNANEAMSDGRGGIIRITVAPPMDGSTVTLLVEDDGPGVPAELVPQLFQPFTTSKRGAPLAGLGLAVARQLLESAGGGVRYLPGPAGAPGARFAVDVKVWER
jgi:two-component system nitrogen regulation sensor histidine kinase GlnL